MIFNNRDIIMDEWNLITNKRFLLMLSTVNSHLVYSLLSLISELNLSNVFKLPVTVFNDNQSCNKSIETGGKFKSNRHYRIRENRIRRAVKSVWNALSIYTWYGRRLIHLLIYMRRSISKCFLIRWSVRAWLVGNPSIC